MRSKALFIAVTALLSFASCTPSQETAVEQTSGQIIELESDGWKLIGTLEMPEGEGPFPAVLLCHQFSRDRTVYENLAGLLRERGIASFRLDLRGHGDSSNLGGADYGQMRTSWPDVIVGFEYLKGVEGVDAERIGVLGASYSGEAVAVAGREAGFGKAYIVMSSDLFSEESMAAMDGSGAAWWFIAASDDGPRTPGIMERAAAASEAAELTMYETGGHGTNLFGTYPELEGQIADWFATKLK